MERGGVKPSFLFMGLFSWVGDAIEDVGDAIGDAVGSIVDEVGDVVESALGAIEDALEDVGGVVDDALQDLLSTYQTYGDASSSLLIENPPDPLRETIISSVLNDQNIANNIITLLLNGFRGKVDRYWRYGVEQFELGLPEGNLTTTGAVQSILQGIIEQEINRDIEILIAYYDVASVSRITVPVLMEYRGYNPVTRYAAPYRFTRDFDLSAFNWPSGSGNGGSGDTSPYLENGIRHILTTSISDYRVRVDWGYTVVYYEPRLVQGSTLSGQTFFYYVPARRTRWFTFSENLSVPRYSQTNSYYYVSYFVLDSSGERQGIEQRWVHDATESPYPQLRPDVLNQTSNSYYPIVPVRNFSEDLTQGEYRDTELFRTSQRLLRIINIDIDEIAEALNANEDIDKIYSAYILFGADLSLDDPIVNKYYFHFFDDLYTKSRYTRDDYNAYLLSEPSSPPPFNIVEIKDGGYQMLLGYLYITKRTLNGLVAAPGEFIREIILADNETVGRNGIPIIEYTGSFLLLRHQLNASQFNEIRIQSPTHINKLLGDYIFSGAVTSYESNLKQVVTKLSEVLDPSQNKHNFIIPLDRYLVRQHFTLAEQEQLFFRSLRICFNTYFERELRWYETEAFEAIMAVVAVVVIVVSAGSAASAVSAAYSAGGAAAAAYLIVTYIVQALVIRLAFEALADEINPGILAAFAVLATAYGVANPGSVLASGSVAGAPFAIDFLTAANGAMAAVQKQLKEDTTDLLEEVGEYQEKMENLLEEDSDTIELDPLEAVGLTSGPPDLLGMFNTPDQYFESKIHTGNIGTLSIDAISKYVELALTLDKQLV